MKIGVVLLGLGLIAAPLEAQSPAQLFDLAQRVVLGRTIDGAKSQALAEVKKNAYRILDTPARDGLYTPPGITFNIFRSNPDRGIKKSKCVIEMADTTAFVNSKYCDIVKVQQKP